ncbi:MAG: S-layer homology domain-containing protein, partial [Clostridiales Family XIII bacterium]|nr:S-layer homology domain-containing protein [Clostridiales Family XIII bacterium]
YTTSSFSDVSASQYYAPYVEWAKESGVVLGVGENRFEPDAGITRQDIAVMITRYAEFANKQFPVTLKYNIFADANEIGDYAKNAVDTLCNANIINGIGGNLFNPKGLATRAEVSAILHRFILAANLQSGTAAEAVSEAEAAAETTTAGAIGTGGAN